ncbi:XRE family transcriptional regulator [Mycolicibacterium llatzerense]|uniref:XRE family transcriptional regulator n=1 Tax=Mycolicibacterium llatzerense TaxID=280871 RepID=UPI0021B4DF1C|nr:XRE family transcriptional regulator [Mycolicibacterium llatzerense]
MPRTDENGRQLAAVLDYLLDGEIHAADISAALGISHSTYYRRIKQGDYPDAEELRRVAASFELNLLDLLVGFGLMSDEDMARAAQDFCERRQILRAPIVTPAPPSDRSPQQRRQRPPRP